MSAVDFAEVEALRDMGMNDVEIADELGCTLLELRPAEETTLPPVFKQEPPSLLATINEFRDDEAALESLLASEMPQSGRASCVPFGKHKITRAGLARRVAQRMAERKGLVWWQLQPDARAKFAVLAAQFVVALEEVAVDGDGVDARARVEERLERSL